MNKRKTWNRGILFVVSAPSGTGKTTVVSEYLKNARGIGKTVSHTTRLLRRGERNGRDYHFVTEKHFLEMIREGRFLEWTSVYGHLYGTTKTTVKRGLAKGDLILVIEGKGGRAIRRAFRNSVSIAILPPSLADLKKRILRRTGRKTAEAARRLRACRKEVRAVTWYDYVIVNDRVGRAACALATIVDAERHKLSRRPDLLKPFL